MTHQTYGARNLPRDGWRGAALAAALLAAGAAQAEPAGDVAAGERVFARCRSCHQVGESARNLAGPQLNGVIGRTSGTVPGYAYTPALKKAAIVWDRDTIAIFVKTPQALVKGTHMIAIGALTPADIDDLVTYLGSFAADGTPAN